MAFCTKLVILELARRGSLATRYRDVLPTHPIERIADVERLDIIQGLQPVSAAEYPDVCRGRSLVSARHGGGMSVVVTVRRDQRRVRDGEGVGVIVARYGLATVDDDDLSSYQS